MSNLVAKTLEKLEDKLPERWDWMALQRDVHLLAETSQEQFWQNDYSRNNPAGPYEQSIVPEKLDRALEALDEQITIAKEVNLHLAGIESDATAIRENTGEMVTTLYSSDEGINQGNILLESMDSNTERMSENIELLVDINRENLVATSIVAGAAIKILAEAEQTNDNLESIDGTLASIDDTLDEVVENQQIMIDALEHGFELLANGQRIIVRELQDIGAGVNRLNY